MEIIKPINNSLGDISTVINDEYTNIASLLKYYIANGYLPDVNIEYLFSGSFKFQIGTLELLQEPKSGDTLKFTLGSGNIIKTTLSGSSPFTVNNAVAEGQVEYPFISFTISQKTFTMTNYGVTGGGTDSITLIEII